MLYQDLKGAIKAECLTISRLARKRGISASYLNNALNGRSSLRIDIAYEIMSDLKLPLDRIGFYFPPGGVRTDQSTETRLRPSSNVIRVGRR